MGTAPHGELTGVCPGRHRGIAVARLGLGVVPGLEQGDSEGGGDRPLNWHPEKAGMVEHLHGTIKNV